MKRAMTPVLTSLLVLVLLAGGAWAQRGPGRGRGGPGNGRGGPGFGGGGFGGAGQTRGGPGFQGGQQDASFAVDRDTIHFLLDRGNKIRRNVKLLNNGIETLTESDDPVIAGKIKVHVAAMYSRLEENRPFRLRDPLFRELFKNAGKINMKMAVTKKGMHVIETTNDPKVVWLLHEHARVVSMFIKRGRAEARKIHPVPAVIVGALQSKEKPVVNRLVMFAAKGDITAKGDNRAKVRNTAEAACCSDEAACCQSKGSAEKVCCLEAPKKDRKGAIQSSASLAARRRDASELGID